MEKMSPENSHSIKEKTIMEDVGKENNIPFFPSRDSCAGSGNVRIPHFWTTCYIIDSVISAKIQTFQTRGKDIRN